MLSLDGTEFPCLAAAWYSPSCRLWPNIHLVLIIFFQSCKSSKSSTSNSTTTSWRHFWHMVIFLLDSIELWCPSDFLQTICKEISDFIKALQLGKWQEIKRRVGLLGSKVQWPRRGFLVTNVLPGFAPVCPSPPPPWPLLHTNTYYKNSFL